MESDVRIEKVDAVQTRGGNTRYVVRDDQGREYTTFRPAIGQAAEQAEGSRARIAFHEEERNGFRNVYLDAVERVAESTPPGSGDSDPEEAAWRTAVEAAPYLLGGDEAREGEVPPEEAFEKLKPFKDLVSEDIRSGPSESSDRGD